MSTERNLYSACLTMRHDFGLLDKSEQERIMNEARMWAEVFAKEDEAARLINAPAQAAPATAQDYPFYELRFIMRVLSHRGSAPRVDWDTAYGMAREIFKRWSMERIAAHQQESAAAPAERAASEPTVADFKTAFAKLGYQWSDSNVAKAKVGWELAMQSLAAQAPQAPVGEFVDQTDPGYEVETLRNHVRILERRVRDLHRASMQAPQAPQAPAGRPAVFGDEEHVQVPRALLGAACSVIDKKRGGAKTLAELRRYTVGDLSTASMQAPAGEFRSLLRAEIAKQIDPHGEVSRQEAQIDMADHLLVKFNELFPEAP